MRPGTGAPPSSLPGSGCPVSSHAACTACAPALGLFPPSATSRRDAHAKWRLGGRQGLLSGTEPLERPVPSSCWKAGLSSQYLPVDLPSTVGNKRPLAGGGEGPWSQGSQCLSGCLDVARAIWPFVVVAAGSQTLDVNLWRPGFKPHTFWGTCPLQEFLASLRRVPEGSADPAPPLLPVHLTDTSLSSFQKRPVAAIVCPRRRKPEVQVAHRVVGELQEANLL